MKSLVGILVATFVLSQVTASVVPNDLQSLKLNLDDYAQKIVADIDKASTLVNQALEGPLVWKQKVVEVKGEVASAPQSCQEAVDQQLDQQLLLADKCANLSTIIGLLKDATLEGFGVLGDVAIASRDVADLFTTCIKVNPFSTVTCISKQIDDLKNQIYNVRMNSGNFTVDFHQAVQDIEERINGCTKSQATFEGTLDAIKKQVKTCSKGTKK